MSEHSLSKWEGDSWEELLLSAELHGRVEAGEVKFANRNSRHVRLPRPGLSSSQPGNQFTPLRLNVEDALPDTSLRSDPDGKEGQE